MEYLRGTLSGVLGQSSAKHSSQPH